MFTIERVGVVSVMVGMVLRKDCMIEQYQGYVMNKSVSNNAPTTKKRKGR